MLDQTDADWRTEQREAARRRILDAAWAQAEREGVGALSLRQLARSLGMTAPSLYSYFPSKDAIYDAMFAEAWDQLRARLEALDLVSGTARERLARGVRTYLAFCSESLARYELMSRRPVPGWEPSPDAYAHSVRNFELLVGSLGDLGVTEPRHIDLYTAVFAGLAAQQMSNEPGGDRWVRLTDEAVDMFLTHVERAREHAT